MHGRIIFEDEEQKQESNRTQTQLQKQWEVVEWNYSALVLRHRICKNEAQKVPQRRLLCFMSIPEHREWPLQNRSDPLGRTLSLKLLSVDS